MYINYYVRLDARNTKTHASNSNASPRMEQSIHFDALLFGCVGPKKPWWPDVRVSACHGSEIITEMLCAFCHPKRKTQTLLCYSDNAPTRAGFSSVAKLLPIYSNIQRGNHRNGGNLFRNNHAIESFNNQWARVFDISGTALRSISDAKNSVWPILILVGVRIRKAGRLIKEPPHLRDIPLGTRTRQPRN